MIMSTEHTCLHGGWRREQADGYIDSVYCGECGWLCDDMCKADRADARTDRLVEGLALVAVFSIPENLLEAMAAGDMFGGDEADGRKFMANAARTYAAALRDWKGGEGN